MGKQEECTTEFKLEDVRQVKAGQAIAVVATVLNIAKASMSNWVHQYKSGTLGIVSDKPRASVVT